MLTGLDGTVVLRHAVGQTRHAGLPMPGYGFGCYKIWDAADCVRAVRTALDCGYRYIDTAAFYKNEEAVGKALRESGLAREDIFVVTKVWPTFFDRPVEALHESLRLLGLDYVDGYLLHWPGTSRDARLRAFERLLGEQERGYIHALGVSNYLAPHMDEIHSVFGLWPAMNQIEVHPAFAQRELCAYCAQLEVPVIAWAPMGRGRLLEHPVVTALAAELGHTPAQVILRWHMQQGRIAIPKSSTPQRIVENAQVFDFALPAQAMAALDALDLPNKAGRTGADPWLFAG